MQAAVVEVLGEAPSYKEFPDPIAGEGEILVQVRAAGLHPIVRALASGSHYLGTNEVPMIPGVDGVGTLEGGSRVFFGLIRKPWGTMAERAAVPRQMCVQVPSTIDDSLAAAVANPGMSAWLSLKERARVTAGETVLVLGATGVAGQIALQVARYLGAKRVIAAGRNVAAIGAKDTDGLIALDEPDDVVRESFAVEVASGIDVVIDYLWGRPTELLLEVLAKGFRSNANRRTRLVEVGESAGKTITLPGATLRSVDLTMMGSGFGAVPLERVLAAVPMLFSLAAAGIVKVAVEPVALAEVETAWSRVEKGRRIVFTV